MNRSLRRSPGRRVAGVVVGLVAATTACGISGSGDAKPLDVGLGLDDTVPTSTTTSTSTSTTVFPASSTSVAEATTTIVLTESVQLYFISGGRLTYVPTPLVSPATLSQVMAALQAGVSALGALGVGLRSALPPPSRSLIEATDNGNGNATVSLSLDFFDVIPQTDQRLAIAQLVLTLTNQKGIGSVSFRSGGQPIPVPLGSGELSEPGQVLTRLDYMSLATTDPVPTTAPSTTDPATTEPATTAPPAAEVPTTTPETSAP